MRGLQLLIQIYSQAYCHMNFNQKLFSLTAFIVKVAFGILLLRQETHLATQFLFFGMECAAVYCIMFHKAFAIPRIIRNFKAKVTSVAKTNDVFDPLKKTLKCVRSVPTVAIRVWSFHTFERMSNPSFLGFAIKSIVRILIAFRNR